jgi:hypothetical protein
LSNGTYETAKGDNVGAEILPSGACAIFVVATTQYMQVKVWASNLVTLADIFDDLFEGYLRRFSLKRTGARSTLHRARV